MNKRKINWRYAIGEVLIVSIGILIAFGINTYSSSLSRKSEVKEYKYSLITDLNENLKSINRIIIAQEIKVEQLNSVVESLDQGNYVIDSISSMLFAQRKSPTFFPISGTFKSLVAQGKIGIFDTELKRELFNLYDTNYERTVYNGELFDKVYVEVYDHQIRDIINLKTKKVEDIEQLTSLDFRKDLLLIIDEAESYLQLLSKSKIESQKMIKLIEK